MRAHYSIGIGPMRAKNVGHSLADNLEWENRSGAARIGRKLAIFLSTNTSRSSKGTPTSRLYPALLSSSISKLQLAFSGKGHTAKLAGQ